MVTDAPTLYKNSSYANIVWSTVLPTLDAWTATETAINAGRLRAPYSKTYYQTLEAKIVCWVMLQKGFRWMVRRRLAVVRQELERLLRREREENNQSPHNLFEVGVSTSSTKLWYDILSILFILVIRNVSIYALGFALQ